MEPCMKYMNIIKFLTVVIFSVFLVSNSYAGIELVCQGGQAQSQGKIFTIDCSNHEEFVKALGGAWQLLQKNSIEEYKQNLCWEAYSDAKETDPSMSFVYSSNAYLARCNPGLESVN